MFYFLKHMSQLNFLSFSFRLFSQGSKSAVKADMSDSATVLKSLQQKVDRVEYKKSSDGNKLVKVVRVNPVSLAK